MKTQTKTGALPQIKRALICVAIGLAVTFIVLLIFAAVMSTGAGSMGLENEYVIVSVIIGATVAGLLNARGRESGVLLAGLMSAAAYVLILMLGSLFIPAGENEGSILLKNILAALTGSVFGAVLCLYRKTKKSKKRRR